MDSITILLKTLLANKGTLDTPRTPMGTGLHEGRSMRPQKKTKLAKGAPHTLYNILVRMEAKRLHPGQYDVEGYTIVVGEDGKTAIQCPHCGLEIPSSRDYTWHTQKYHKGI